MPEPFNIEYGLSTCIHCDRQEHTLLLDPRFRIILVNMMGSETVQFSGSVPAGTGFFSIIDETDSGAAEINGIWQQNIQHRRLIYRGCGGPVDTDSYMSKIYDRFNDLAGYLVISRVNRERAQFKRAFRITERASDNRPDA